MQKVYRKMGAIGLILVLSLVYIYGDIPVFLQSLREKVIISSLVYHFYHANVFHLMVNCICIYTIMQRRRAWATLPLAYLAATLAYSCAVKPVIGFSDILFASMGLLTPPLYDSWWKSRNMRIFLVVTILMSILPNVSAFTHLMSFVLGVAFSVIVRECRSLKKDLAYVRRIS